jgi:uncharacterized paraquat-inducible protein A
MIFSLFILFFDKNLSATIFLDLACLLLIEFAFCVEYLNFRIKKIYKHYGVEKVDFGLNKYEQGINARAF